MAAFTELSKLECALNASRSQVPPLPGFPDEKIQEDQQPCIRVLSRKDRTGHYLHRERASFLLRNWLV